MLAAVIINTICCVLGMLRHEEYKKTDMIFAFVNTTIIWEDRGCVGY